MCSFLTVLISNSARFSWIPGSESTHLDLEKLFLLSDSLENFNFNGKFEISEPEKLLASNDPHPAKNILFDYGFNILFNYFVVISVYVYICIYVYICVYICTCTHMYMYMLGLAWLRAQPRK